MPLFIVINRLQYNYNRKELPNGGSFFIEFGF